MNKLQEAINNFSENLAYDSDDTHLMYFDCSPDTVREGLAKIIVEYARSVIDYQTYVAIELPLDQYIQLESAWEKKHKEMFDRIDQDLQSLNN